MRIKVRDYAENNNPQFINTPQDATTLSVCSHAIRLIEQGDTNGALTFLKNERINANIRTSQVRRQRRFKYSGVNIKRWVEI